MPTVRIDYDEAYPVFHLVDPDEYHIEFGVQAELTDEEIARFKAAQDEWDAVQRILAQRANWAG